MRRTSGRRVAIVGVGYSDVGRNTGLSERHHAAQAAVRALDDAGLTAKDIELGSLTRSQMSDPAVADAAFAKPGRACKIRSTGKGSPMTPVDAT